MSGRPVPGYSQLPMGSDDPAGKAGRRKCCGPGWQLTALVWMAAVGLVLFGALLLALVLSGPEMHATTSATVDMHEKMLEGRQAAMDWVQSLRDHFPAGQDRVLAEQIVDTVDRVHGMVTWADAVRMRIDPAVAASLVAKVDAFLGNTTLLVELMDAFLAPESAGQASRGIELLRAVDPEDVRSILHNGNAALKSVASLDREKVGRLVDRAADILGAADSSHVVSVITRVTQKVSQALDRFLRPGGGVRLSLPLAAPASGLIAKKRQ